TASQATPVTHRQDSTRHGSPPEPREAEDAGTGQHRAVGMTTGARSTIAGVRIYTGKGDDGTTGLYFGGRVRKDSIRIELNGAVDEAQAALGAARAEFDPGSEA